MSLVQFQIEKSRKEEELKIARSAIEQKLINISEKRVKEIYVDSNARDQIKILD